MKRFLFELYLFAVMGYMVSEYMATGGKFKDQPIVNSNSYASDGVGYKIPPSFRLAGFSFVGWGIAGIMRIARHKPKDE